MIINHYNTIKAAVITIKTDAVALTKLSFVSSVTMYEA